VIKQGKTNAESNVTVQNGDRKFDASSVTYNAAATDQVQEIRLGGTATKLVFDSGAKTAAAEGDVKQLAGTGPQSIDEGVGVKAFGSNFQREGCDRGKDAIVSAWPSRQSFSNPCFSNSSSTAIRKEIASKSALELHCCARSRASMPSVPAEAAGLAACSPRTLPKRASSHQD